MTEWLKLDEATRKASIEQAAIRQGIRAKAIEKDWWVTLTLKALFTSKYKDHLLFKGGTSLSKGWKLIKRFSEDIDLALSPEAINMSYQENPGKGYIDRLRKGACDFTTNQLKVELQKQFEALGVPSGFLTIEAEEVKSSDKDPQRIFIHYPAVIEPEEYIKDFVMIEVSARSLKDPSTLIRIQSLLIESFPKLYIEEPLNIMVVEPHRTFLEKVFLLHELFQSTDQASKKGSRMSRHLYDLVQMMDEEPGKKALKDQKLYETIIKHRLSYNKEKGVDYTTHNTSIISFIPPVELIENYKDDYTKMRETMIYGDPPDFPDLVSGLGELLRRFRQLSDKELLQDQYESMAGNYIRWWEDDKQKSNGRVFVRANIRYETDIKYTIIVSTLINYSRNSYGVDYQENEIERWQGEIIMESPNIGTVIWHQINPKNRAKGYKKISYDRESNRIVLIGEKKAGFGDEVFTDKEAFPGK